MSQLEKRFWAKVNKTKKCWLWTAYCDKDGYGHIKVGSKMQLAHRVSYSIKYGPLKNNTEVRHKCDVKNCVRPSHLIAGTHQENMRDLTERHSSFGLVSKNNARKIRDKYQKGGVTQTELGLKFNVSQQTISKVILNQLDYLK